LTYEAGKGPPSAADLQAEFRYNGLIDDMARVHGHHAYVFERVDEAGYVHLRNPWGHAHPEPLSLAELRANFSFPESVEG